MHYNFIYFKLKNKQYVRNKKLILKSNKKKLSKFKLNKKLLFKLKKKNLLTIKVKYHWLKNKIKLFKNDIFFFIKKIFYSFIRAGKKHTVINYFLKIVFFLCLRINKKSKICKTLYLYLFFFKIAYNIIPIFIYTNLMFRGETIVLPWVRKNKKTNKIKLLKISISWIKKSICKRKEKTLFFKIFSELEELAKNKGESMQNKKSYYLNFHEKKHYLRFLNRKIWV